MPRRTGISRPGLWSVLALALWSAACRPGVASAEESDRIAEALALAAGMRVADVGAGDGRWAAEIARRVGSGGHVWATEVDAEELGRIGDRVRSDGLDNVTPVLGDVRDTGLPAGCCDAILLRLVYHHFTDPAAMRASLARALRPGGRLVVVDIAPQSSWRELQGVPDRGGHGIPMEALITEMRADGWDVVERIEDWPGEEDRFCVVFRRGLAAGS